MKPRIIIWGFPLDTHTHSYIHAGWFKAFKHLGYETYWFDDSNYPKNFDFNNCLFISEEYAATNIPVVKTSTYFIHNAIKPLKYLSQGARLIDIRFNVYHINDVNYKLVVDKTKLYKIDDVSFFEENANDSVLSDQYEKGVANYEAVYMSWATDLLPHEFDFETINLARENACYYVGSIGDSNYYEIKKVGNALRSCGIPLYHIDPWRQAVTFEEGRKYIEKSIIALDVRGSQVTPTINGKPGSGANHKNIGYIPCRTFKAISYGRRTGTNSKAVKELFGDLIIYNDDENQLTLDLLEAERSLDKDLVKTSMELVQRKHTYLNRIESLMKIFYKDMSWKIPV